jgi:hypothetical protein
LARFQLGITEWFLRFGFRLKVELVTDVFERIQFCQTSPIWTPKGWVAVRHPHTAVTKDNYAMFNVSSKLAYDRYVKTLGLCGLSLTRGVPMLQSFYLSMMDSNATKPLENLDAMAYYYRHCKINGRPQEVHWYTRVSFWKAFDITPQDQISFEKRCARYRFEYLPYKSVEVDIDRARCEGPLVNFWDLYRP